MIIFFSIIPILIGGLGNILIPLLLGKNDMDMPRWNAFRFWISIPAVILLSLSAFIGSGAATRWTVYPPLSSKVYHSRNSVDVVVFSLHLAGIASLIRSINFIITTRN